jgi:transposase-like protein
MEERFALVAKVLAGRSIMGAAREAHVSSGQLYQWVKRYREKGMDGLECRRGKPPKEPIMPKKKAKLTPSEREELEILRARNEYLEAENAYLKKLDALVTEREAARPKARKRKSSKG